MVLHSTCQGRSTSTSPRYRLFPNSCLSLFAECAPCMAQPQLQPSQGNKVLVIRIASKDWSCVLTASGCGCLHGTNCDAQEIPNWLAMAQQAAAPSIMNEPVALCTKAHRIWFISWCPVQSRAITVKAREESSSKSCVRERYKTNYRGVLRTKCYRISGVCSHPALRAGSTHPKTLNIRG